MANPYLAWSLSDDFSIYINPSSVWSYGYKNDVAGPLTLFTHLQPETSNKSIYAWFEAGVSWETGGHWLGVYYNTKTTNTNIGYPYKQNITFPPHGVGMSPEYDGKYSVARFTAPMDGIYSLTATFIHICIDSNVINAHTNGQIIHNDLDSLFYTDIFGMGDAKLYNSDKSINLKANDTIDFIVGVGSDNFLGDMTNVNAYIRLLQKNATTGINSTTIIGSMVGIAIGVAL
ncbi:30825_t:CDS:1, partial [Gigaspora margarita]